MHFGIDFPLFFLNGLACLDPTETLCLPIRSRVGRLGKRPRSPLKTKEKTVCDRGLENEGFWHRFLAHFGASGAHFGSQRAMTKTRKFWLFFWTCCRAHFGSFGSP